MCQSQFASARIPAPGLTFYVIWIDKNQTVCPSVYLQLKNEFFFIVVI